MVVDLVGEGRGGGEEGFGGPVVGVEKGWGGGGGGVGVGGGAGVGGPGPEEGGDEEEGGGAPGAWGEGGGDEGEEAGAGDGEGSGGVGLGEAGRGGGEVLHLWTGGEEGGKVLGEETNGLREIQLEAGLPGVGGGRHADGGGKLARSGPEELQELGHAGSVTVGVVEVNEHDEAGSCRPEAQLDSSHRGPGVACVETRKAKTCIKEA